MPPAPAAPARAGSAPPPALMGPGPPSSIQAQRHRHSEPDLARAHTRPLNHAPQGSQLTHRTRELSYAGRAGHAVALPDHGQPHARHPHRAQDKEAETLIADH
eukprot:3704582-Pyramimonas_sp.AAC.1